MADELRLGGTGSGLAVLLTSEDRKDCSHKSHRVLCCDDINDRSIERTLEHVFDLPLKSLHSTDGQIDCDFIHSILKSRTSKVKSVQREGILITDNGHGPNVVNLDEASMCGDMRIVKQPLILESVSMFSSARANAHVWRGKWMYEVTLETSGIQQLGWATLFCPFTDQNGVGDAQDSYAFDGKRVQKWNEEAEQYGQTWVVGDVIGCCIDLDDDKISFYRNGVSLGVAFYGIRKMGPDLGYFPAVSLSQGERCELNFGACPFKHPVNGFLPIQSPPLLISHAEYLLQCLLRLLEIECLDRTDSVALEKLRILKRFTHLDELFYPAAHEICKELFSVLELEVGIAEYIGGGVLVSFLLDLFGRRAPHDFRTLDRVLDLFLDFSGFHSLFLHLISGLSSSCKTASLVLADCPFSGSYPYLALACHFLRHEELMVLWWKSSDFEFLFEGFLSRRTPNKQDLQQMMPSVWWPGSYDDMSSESSMILTTSALSGAISKIEEMHRELCHLVIRFVPPMMPPQLPGSVFRTFLQNVILKNRGFDRNLPSFGGSSNFVLVSLYTVILHFLSEGFSIQEICGCPEGYGLGVGFLHRGGHQSFPVMLFLKIDPHRTDLPRLGGSFDHLLKSNPGKDVETEDIHWDEGCMDDEETKVTHSSRQKPCCCSSSDDDFTRNSKDPVRNVSKFSRGPCSSIPERSAHVAADCSGGGLNDEIVDKPSSSDQSESNFGYRTVQHFRIINRETQFSSDMLKEEELLDAMLLLYHLGLAPQLKQAFYYMSQQSQAISLLDETDKQIRERSCSEQLKNLKDVRNIYREQLVDCIRQCAWYRMCLFSRWKQRGMYATCTWVVQLLLVLSDADAVFLYVPEFYVEALVDCFHALRRSDPPFVSPAVFIKQGLTSFITFVVKHFDDARISSADLRDLLLQSISVLVQYKEYMAMFERNYAAIHRMPRALLSAFDNRSWIVVTNILLRLCKGSGFGSSKQRESSSLLFQGLLRDACILDERLFSGFLNRLFNTLSWTMTEFSVAVREMQENYPVLELQQRKCSVVFDLSCNLARVLEFCTREIPQAFLSGSDMNLRRLTELIVFILNHITSASDAEFFDMLLRRQGQSLEKMNRALILSPLCGIMLNLMEASADLQDGEPNDVIGVFASMDCPSTVYCGFQYLLNYNWSGFLRGDASLARLVQLENFLSHLRMRTEPNNQLSSSEGEEVDNYCCICYASDSNAQFEPCRHKSCFGCITRHLLNSQRCFFCNATVVKVMKVD
ncbi:E3 ubiquitin-protein ligase RKP [Acorus calamus]|uniref:RING-type E3 ubiquitin transferase n=1 Tax=Acorus calamus TaxID=4465 RepID=A0AAV9DKP6_ACOCL|nr:E3 ubiquitin-protein ligase RKP [Acorus calamus]